MWPFKKKKVELSPEEAWSAAFTAWLEQFYKLAEAFPDHSALEGRRLTDSQWQMLDQLGDLYSEDLRLVLERMTLKNEALKRSFKRSETD